MLDMPPLTASLSPGPSPASGRGERSPTCGREVEGEDQCSFTRGSVRRVMRRAAVSRIVFHQPCSAISCSL